MRNNNLEELRSIRDRELGRANKLLSSQPTIADADVAKAHHDRRAQQATPHIKQGLEAGFGAIAEELEQKKGCGLVGVAILSVGGLLSAGGIYALQQLVK